MKITLKIHPKSQNDIKILGKVMAILAEAEIDPEEKSDPSGLASHTGPVTQEAIKKAVSEYKAPETKTESQPNTAKPVEQTTSAAVTEKVAPVSTPAAQVATSVVTAPSAPVSAAQPAAQEVKTESTLAIQDLRSKSQQKILAGHREAVKALLEKYKIAQVTALPQEQWASFNAELDAIK